MRLLFSLLAWVAGTASMIALAESRPNVIIIVCDDMGFSDIGCFGGEIDTPNLDRLAARGLRFTDFHNNAKCSETRASIMTGLWHQQSNHLKSPGHVTMAEVLRQAGYRTLMSGKWHLASTPTQRGFDRYFGFLSGAINYFTGLDWQTGENLMRLNDQAFEPGESFYSTDAFTDYAIRFLDETSETGKPFFLYLTHNAPHFPLHALPEDIAKYKGRYREGWDVIRRQRHEQLARLGVIDETWRLSARDPQVEAWETLAPQQIEFMTPMMEVYAAMVDRLDQNIGRLVAHLEATNQIENTLILFFSDNGACPYQRLNTPGIAPGPAESDIAYDARWANMCNSPLRLYKQYAHQGGTLTPMIAHWPNGIEDPGALRSFPSHLVDLMPTVIELTGAAYPEEFAGQAILPMEGVSFAPALRGQATSRSKPIFWEFSGNHAIRLGDWKLVAERSKEWELYDLSADRTETEDLAIKEAGRVRELSARYDDWAKRVGAKTHAQCVKAKPSTQSQLFDLTTVAR